MLPFSILHTPFFRLLVLEQPAFLKRVEFLLEDTYLPARHQEVQQVDYILLEQPIYLKNNDDPEGETD